MIPVLRNVPDLQDFDGFAAYAVSQKIIAMQHEFACCVDFTGPSDEGVLSQVFGGLFESRGKYTGSIGIVLLDVPELRCKSTSAPSVHLSFITLEELLDFLRTREAALIRRCNGLFQCFDLRDTPIEIIGQRFACNNSLRSADQLRIVFPPVFQFRWQSNVELHGIGRLGFGTHLYSPGEMIANW